MPVDFRDQRGVYALYAEYELVYVGQTGAGDAQLFKRLRSHLTDHLAGRWNQFSWFGTQWVTKKHRLSTDRAAAHESVAVALNILEAVGIAISEPRLNLQRGRWGGAKQYLQYVIHNSGKAANNGVKPAVMSRAVRMHVSRHLVPQAYARTVSWTERRSSNQKRRHPR